MDPGVNAALDRQLGAAIDMLENAIRACPDGLWSDRSRRPEFWYLAFHTLFYLDDYLSDSAAEFAPPAPFTLDELNPEGVLPERPYSREQLLAYLEHGRAKRRAVLGRMTEAEASRRRAFPWGVVSGVELLLYNLRHVQHNAAQLHLILRQQTDSAPRWVAIPKHGSR